MRILTIRTSKIFLLATLLFFGFFLGFTTSAPSAFAFDDSVEVSPKKPWGDFSKPRKESHSVLTQILLWPVNRVLDIIDVFKFDIGVGPGVGAVVRVTKWGQLGYRQMLPASLRIGNFGRSAPARIEPFEEIGIGPFFRESSVRTVCPGEVGAGVDALLFGVYAGVCVEEIFDFGAGVLFFDPMDDDL